LGTVISTSGSREEEEEAPGMGWAVVRVRARRIEGFLTKVDPITRDMTGTARHTRRLLTLMPPEEILSRPGRGNPPAARLAALMMAS
jgi:hypothetical protein